MLFELEHTSGIVPCHSWTDNRGKKIVYGQSCRSEVRKCGARWEGSRKQYSLAKRDFPIIFDTLFRSIDTSESSAPFCPAGPLKNYVLNSFSPRCTTLPLSSQYQLSDTPALKFTALKKTHPSFSTKNVLTRNIAPTPAIIYSCKKFANPILLRS